MAGGVVSFAWGSLKDPKSYLYLLGFLLFLFVPVLNFFAWTWLGALVVLRAFTRLGTEAPRLGFMRFVKLVLLDFVNFFVGALSLYNLRWLQLLVVVLVLQFVFTAWVPLPLFGLVASAYFFVYGLVVVHNCFRLWFARFVFLSSDAGLFESSKTAWRVTRGRFWELFVGLLVLSVACLLVYLVLSAALGLAVGAVAGAVLGGLLVALLQASPVSAYLGLVPGLAAVISSVLVGLLMAVVLSPLYSILVLSGASKLYLDALGEGRPFGSRPEDGSPKPAWESYKPGPGERPSKYQSLAELAEDKDLEAEEVEELDKPASPSAAAKRKGKPAKEEEPEEVQELDFGGLEEEGGEEK